MIAVREVARRLVGTWFPALTRNGPERATDRVASVTPTGELRGLLESVTKILEAEPAVLELDGEVCVVGDIHGNLDGLLRIFEQFGYPPNCTYLFLGDYIDRGRNSCEVILLLFALKIIHPKCVHMLRGNHEFPDMASAYGFKAECESQFGLLLFEKIIDAFQYLPMAAVIGFNFCVHGGISPRLQHWSQIRKIQKLPRTAPYENSDAMALVWSDPSPDVHVFGPSPRGCGFVYGDEAVNQFTQADGVEHRIIRAHESCPRGFDWPIPENGKVLTVFSSCDYCETGNDAAVALVHDQDLSVQFCQFAPLTGSRREKRRVQYPTWMLEVQMKPIEVDLLDDICMDIEV
jgi:diadenosine tetraphosphatase ApaH/serine/threonine PP2A family protein phosphatase